MNLNFKFISAVLIGIILSAFVLIISAHRVSAAVNYGTGNTVSLSKEEVINSDYFAAGNTVILDGTVNGDAYVAGGNIVVTGTVNGDLLAAGGNISINGKVTGNVRAAGGQISVTGDVGRNLTLAGGNISVQSPAKIAGSLVLAGGNFTLTSPIGKGMTIGASQASIDTTVNGDVNAAISQLTLLKSTRIEGNLNYWSSQKIDINPSLVRDSIVYHQTNWNIKKPVPASETGRTAAAVFAGFSFFWAITSFATSLVLGLLLLWLTPFYMQNVSTTILTRPWVSLGIGFVAVVLSPIVLIVLLITVIGIPIAFMLFVFLVMFAILNEIFISYAIGKKLTPKNDILALFLGLLIYSIIGIIPFVGWIWNMLALFIGMGAVLTVDKKLYLGLREKKII